MEVMNELADVAGTMVDEVMLQPKECWQPSDFLPNAEKEAFIDELKQLRERPATIPDTVMPSLVGNMIPEEA